MIFNGKTQVRGLRYIIGLMAGAMLLFWLMAPKSLAYTQRNATVNGSDINVRSGAGSSNSAVAKLAKGTAVIITGEQSDSESNTWYEISFTDGGSDKTGYIRYDFLDLGDEIIEESEEFEESPEEAMESEEVAPEPEIPQDFGVEYIETADGTFEWYLDNNKEGVRYKISEIFEAEETLSATVASQEAKISTQRLILIILVVLLAILLGVVIFLAFKIRAAGEEDVENQFDRAAKDRERRMNSRRPEGRAVRGREREEERPRRRGEEERPLRRRGEDEDRMPRRRGEEERPLRRRGEDEDRMPRRRGEEERPLRRRGEEDRPVRRRSEEERPVRRRGEEERLLRRREEEGRPVRHQEEEDFRESKMERQVRRELSDDMPATGSRSKNFLNDVDDDFEYNFVDLDD